MKKEDVFVLIDSEEKRKRVIQILNDAGEVIYKYSTLFDVYSRPFNLSFNNNEWYVMHRVDDEIKITVDQLEELLNPNYAVMEVNLTIDELRSQAEKLGFELVEKKREVKIGYFGTFWDDEHEERPYFNFVRSIKDGWFFDERGLSWQNFRYLTDDEKERITQNW